jgi:hypothetical protein
MPDSWLISSAQADSSERIGSMSPIGQPWTRFSRVPTDRAIATGRRSTR